MYLYISQKGEDSMKNKIKTFTLFVRPDEKSRSIARNIRELNECSENPLIQ